MNKIKQHTTELICISGPSMSGKTTELVKNISDGCLVLSSEMEINGLLRLIKYALKDTLTEEEVDNLKFKFEEISPAWALVDKIIDALINQNIFTNVNKILIDGPCSSMYAIRILEKFPTQFNIIAYTQQTKREK